MIAADGYCLVGVVAVDKTATLSAGSHFVDIGAAPVAANNGGWLTSMVGSPHLGIRSRCVTFRRAISDWATGCALSIS